LIFNFVGGFEKESFDQFDDEINHKSKEKKRNNYKTRGMLQQGKKQRINHTVDNYPK
jgi:hypothetical protein